jgi:endonuclease YncB( thermonuclease family)
MRAMSVTLRSLAIALAVVVAACGPTSSSRYSRKQAQESLHKLETPGVVIGEFTLTRVVDGDTVRVDGLDSALRLVALDCEETFKGEADRRAVEADWENYLKTKRGTKKRPAKAATPMGEQAKLWGKQFFEDTKRVKLERDDPRELRDMFDRYLAYVLVEKGGKWVNYNVEVVRAGMSPYFTKYGYSRRFHDEFVAAEKEARAAQRGIWSPTAMSYKDYDERKAWWDARAEFVKAWDTQAEGKPNWFVVRQWDIMKRLEEQIGREVTLLGTVGDIVLGDRGPTRVTLSRRMFSNVPLIFWDKDVYASTGVGEWRGEFISVTGIVTEYTNKKSKRRQLQIVVDRPDQIRLSPIPGLNMPDAPTPAAGAAGTSKAAPP